MTHTPLFPAYVAICIISSAVSLTACGSGRVATGTEITQSMAPHCPPEKVMRVASEMPHLGIVVAEVESVDIALCAPKFHGFFWGSTDVPPKYLISSARVTVSGQEVEVPASAYADLGDASVLTLSSEGPDIRVHIEGTGVSRWICEWKIKDGLLVSRRVWSIDLPDDAFEETSYHYVDN